MADQSILREYLVALGFKVNQPQAEKFEKGLQRWDKRATNLARGLASVGVAAQAMVAQFAFSMEKLYYSSKRTDSAAGSIKALEYGASRVGVSTDTMRNSLEAMARNLRANPGLTGLLNSLGVQTKGRDKSDVLLDLVTQLKRMPAYVGQQYASLFGIDPDTLFMLQDGLDEMKRASAEREQMAAEMGVDMDAAALAGKEYANQWREITERAGLFRDVVALALLPTMKEMAGVTKVLLQDWAELVNTQPKQGSLMDRLGEGLGVVTPDRVELSAESKARLGIGEGDDSGSASKDKLLGRLYKRFMKWSGAKKYQTPLADQASVDAAQDTSAFQSGGSGRAVSQQAANASTFQGNEGTEALFARLERQYQLPTGILDRVWNTESRRGKLMRSPKGAKGHFQFMDATAAQYGVKDPDDLQQSAQGAARMYSDLLKQYGGDARKAAAAYNWGQGNLAKYGLGSAPSETRKYMDAVAGPAQPSVSQEVNVTVHGSSDPQRAALLVREQVDAANAEVIRNMKAKVH